MSHARLLAMAAFVGAVSVPALTRAQLGNVSYTQAEVGKTLSMFKVAADGPPGIDAVMMLHGYLIVLGTNDSGKPPGVWHTYDIKDPRNPVLIKMFKSATTANQREMHMSTFARVNGKVVVVAPMTTGIAFFDFTDPTNPADVSSLTLTGVNGGDYTNVAWHSSYSWPYVFTGSSGTGVNVTDARDPTKPVLIKTIPIGMTGNFRIGPTYAIGNYLIITNMDQAPFRASVVDVSDPMNPSLLTSVTAPNGQYSTLVIGDWIYGGGEAGNYNFMKWSPTAIKITSSKKIGVDKGGYCTQQDNFAFCGQSADGFHKIDLTDETNPTVVFTGSLGASAPGGDFDFATVMGNLLFEGDDHPSGAGFIPHQMAPDTTPPKVMKIYPEDGATKQPLTTRVTAFFTDEIDFDTATSTNLILRKNDGTIVDSVLSHSSTNAISFGPKQPLEANTTYEVVVVTSGVKDLAGNAIATQTISRFSTGAMVGPGFDGGVSHADAGVDASSGSGGGAGGAGGNVTTGGGGGTDGTGGAAGNMTTTGGGTAGATSSGTYVTSATATTGSTGGGGTSAAPIAGDKGGCACRVPGRPTSSGYRSLVAAALGIGIARLRRRKSGGRTGV